MESENNNFDENQMMDRMFQSLNNNQNNNESLFNQHLLFNEKQQYDPNQEFTNSTSTVEDSFKPPAKIDENHFSMQDQKKKNQNKLNNYQLIKNIGEGAFGSVNLAVDKTRNNKKVAIKQVSILKTCQMNKERHVLRERDLLLSLKHFNIVRMYNTFKDDKNLYFVFENAPNGSLDQLIQYCNSSRSNQQGLGEDLVKIMFSQLVNVTQYMQQEQIMHRDLKPQNIMLDENYNLKVIDFGDARKINEEIDEKTNEMSEGPGRRDTFVGTVNYQSPEVISGDVQTLAVDTWALGNILFKMMYGVVPFKGSNPTLVYKDINARNIQWPHPEKLSQSSKEVQDLIERMIQIQPENRLGHNLESILILKQHPFFQGINFEQIQTKGYDGNKKLVQNRLKELELPEQRQEQQIETNECQQMQIDPNKVLIKGNLLKENRFYSKQLRFFILHQNGDLLYYKDLKDFKGCIKIGPNSKVRKTKKTQISLHCERKNKEYIILQPDGKVNLINEKKLGHNSYIDEWFKELINVVEYTKSAAYQNRAQGAENIYQNLDDSD